MRAGHIAPIQPKVACCLVFPFPLLTLIFKFFYTCLARLLLLKTEGTINHHTRLFVEGKDQTKGKKKTTQFLFLTRANLQPSSFSHKIPHALYERWRILWTAVKNPRKQPSKNPSNLPRQPLRLTSRTLQHLRSWFHRSSLDGGERTSWRREIWFWGLRLSSSPWFRLSSWHPTSMVIGGISTDTKNTGDFLTQLGECRLDLAKIGNGCLRFDLENAEISCWTEFWYDISGTVWP